MSINDIAQWFAIVVLVLDAFTHKHHRSDVRE